MIPELLKRINALAKKAREDKVPKGMWIAICTVLGAAVLIGLVYFLYIMGLFGNFTLNKEADDLPEYNYENQIPQTPVEEVPAEEETPAEEEPVEEEPEEGACTGLTISKTEVAMDEAGGKIFLTAVARPSDCIYPIEFASSDESVATVNENGMITAVGPGVAQIIVTCGDKTEICVVRCEFEASVEEEPEEEPEEQPEPEEAEPVTPPTLDKTDFTLFYPGEETTLTVQNAPEGAAISYVSSNAAVVTVTNNGTVTAVGDGDATITVTVGETKLTCIARCRMETTTEGGSTGAYTGPFTLSHTDVTLFSSGESFTIALMDSTGKTVSGVGWFASNGSVSISGSTIKAVSGGQATVSCVYNGKTYSCIVRCGF